MKIIKEGKPIKKFKRLVGFKTICKKCGCEYEIDLDETKSYLEQGGFICHEWDCPNCNAYQSDSQGGDNSYECIYE